MTARSWTKPETEGLKAPSMGFLRGAGRRLELELKVPKTCRKLSQMNPTLVRSRLKNAERMRRFLYTAVIPDLKKDTLILWYENQRNGKRLSVWA